MPTGGPFGGRQGSSYGSGSGYGMDDRGGGLSGWFRRSVSRGENPLMWALPIGQYFGIAVRVSLIFLVWIAIELIQASGQGLLAFKAYFIAAMFFIVLLHEFGHCFACRWVKGEANEVLMWMLGGLASCRPPHHWKASLITTIGGPAVHIILWPLLAGGVLLAGIPAQYLIFNPFEFTTGGPSTYATDGHLALYQAYRANIYLFIFNVFLPMFPMDGGRMLQEILWSRLGWSRSMKIAATVGVAMAIAVGILAITTGAFILLGIALFAGITSYSMLQQLKFMHAAGIGGTASSPWESDSDTWKMGRTTKNTPRSRGDDLPGSWLRNDEPSAKDQEKAAKAAVLAAEARLKEEAELDRILAKIREQGMGSLSRSEESFLRRTTQEKKQGK